jgi:hypothetical protein
MVFAANVPVGGVALYDAVVAADGNGDFETIGAALAAGNSRIFVRNGVYLETGDLVIPSQGVLVGETPGSVIINFNGGNFSVKVDGTGRLTTAGTQSFTSGSAIVTGVGTSYTTVQANDFIRLMPTFFSIASVDSDTQITMNRPYQGISITGDPVVAQSMSFGVVLQNLWITGSNVEGLNIDQGFHIIAQNILINGCGLNGTSGACHINRSSDCSFFAVVCESNSGPGALMEFSDNLLFSSCAFNNNAGDGVKMGDVKAVTLANCFMLENGANGVDVNDGDTNCIILDGCTLGRNVNKGINTTNESVSTVINACIVRQNGGIGIDFDGANNIIQGSTIEFNGDDGLNAGDEGVVTDCLVIQNAGHGINGGNDTDCIIQSNNVRLNGQDGIRASDNSVVMGNRVYDNTNDGIDIPSGRVNIIVGGNRISGNGGSAINDNGTGTELFNNVTV